MIQIKKDSRWVASVAWDGKQLAVLSGRLTQSELKLVQRKIQKEKLVNQHCEGACGPCGWDECDCFCPGCQTARTGSKEEK